MKYPIKVLLDEKETTIPTIYYNRMCIGNTDLTMRVS